MEGWALVGRFRRALRIIDANLNRAREAARVAEEYARFALDSAAHARRLKEDGLYLIENHYGLVASSDQIIRIISAKR